MIGYNSRAYDSVILRAVLEHLVATCEALYQLSLQLIHDRSNLPEAIRKFRWAEHPWHDMDLMQVKPLSVPGKVQDWSLKKHQIRLRWPDVRDLP